MEKILEQEMENIRIDTQARKDVIEEGSKEMEYGLYYDLFGFRLIFALK